MNRETEEGRRAANDAASPSPSQAGALPYGYGAVTAFAVSFAIAPCPTSCRRWASNVCMP